MHNQFEFTSKQIVFLIIGSTIGTGILSLPRSVAAKAHQDVGLAILIGAILPIVSVLLINFLAKQHPNQDFTSVTQELFGKWLGGIIIVFFVAYMICYVGIIARIFADVTGMYLLRRTPLIILLLVINVSIFYISSQGGKVVARLSELLFYLLCFNYVLILVPAVSFQITNLMPVGETGWREILSGAQVTAYAYGGIEGMLVGIFLMKNPREFVRSGLIATAVVVATYVLVAVVCVGVYGHEAILKFVFPLVTLFKSVEVSIFERLELFFLITWVGLGARPAISFNMLGAHTLTRLLGLEIKRFYPYVVATMCGLSFIFGLLPNDIIEVFKFAEFIGFGVIITALGYPLAYILVGLVRKVV